MYIGHDIHSRKWCWYDSLRRRLRHRHECVERSHKQCEFVYMHTVFKLESTTFGCFEIWRTHDGWFSVGVFFFFSLVRSMRATITFFSHCRCAYAHTHQRRNTRIEWKIRANRFNRCLTLEFCSSGCCHYSHHSTTPTGSANIMYILHLTLDGLLLHRESIERVHAIAQ